MQAPARLSRPHALSPAESKLLVESVEDYAIYMLDVDGRVATWNLGAEKIKGYAADEIIGEHFSKFFSDDDVNAGKPEEELRVAAERGKLEAEGWRVRKDGSCFWANVVVTALHDEAGRLVGFGKVTRDLTERRRAEQAERELIREQAAREAAQRAEEQLRDSEARYRSLSLRLEVILEGVADGITVQDASGRLLFANTAAARGSGFDSAKELLNAPLSSVFARFDLRDASGAPFPVELLPGRRVLRGEPEASALVQVFDREDGSERWSLVRSRGVFDAEGQPELAVNIWHDVTAAQRRERHDSYLSRASAALASTLELGAMLQTLAGLLVPGLADWCVVHLLEGDELRSVAVSHVDPEKVALALRMQNKYPPLRGQPGGAWHVVESRTSALYEEVPDEIIVRAARDREHLELIRSIGMKSVIIAPIQGRERALGTLTLISAESGRRYAADDRSLVEELGRRAGAAIENARLYADEKRAREHLSLLAQASDAFTVAQDYEQTLRSVVEVVLPQLADFAFFDVIEAGEVRRVAAAHDDPELDALIKSTSWRRSERTDKNLCALSSGRAGFHPEIDDAWRVDVALGPEHLALLRRLELCSMITVPLRVRKELLGALTLCYGRSGRHHAPDDVKLGEELARRAYMAVVQARLHGETREAARRAEEASRIKDEFLATVSHELRTPLNAIVGWASLLRGRSADPSIEKGLDVIHRNAEAQVKIIDDILDVSRIVSGKLRLEPRPADLVGVVRDGIEVVRPSAVAKNLRIEFQPPAEPALLVADPERLQQVIWNLLSNAVKFTDPGGSVRVSVAQQGVELVVSVTDTGRGIDRDFLPFVFDRFKQADASTTRRVGGLGLGLALVRHIVELHGGQVSAESAGLGQGATFTVRLPIRAVMPSGLEDTASPRSAAPRSEPPPTTPSLDGLRVLVVDDERDARELLGELLADSGAEVELAASAAEGGERLLSFRPHVMVSDIGMPGEDGYSFMQRVRLLKAPELASVPAIALTAYTRGEDRSRALSAGFTTHLGKPVNPDALLAAVANLGRLTRVGRA